MTRLRSILPAKNSKPLHRPCNNFWRTSATGARYTLALLVVVGSVLLTTGLRVASFAAEYGIVTAETVTQYVRPDTSSATVAQLRRGDEFEIIKRQNGWYYIRFKNQIGFIADLEDTLHVIGSGAETPPTADPGLNTKIKRLEKKAGQIQKKIQKTESQLKAYTDKEVAVLTHLNDIDYSIDRVRRRIVINRRELASLEQKIETATDTQKRLAADIQSNEAYATRRLVVLYKMSWFDRMQFLASAESVFEFIERKQNLERIWKHDQTIRHRLVKDKEKLNTLLARLETQHRQKKTLQDAVRRELRILNTQRKQRTRILNDIRSKRALEKAALDTLKTAANELNTKIGALNTAPVTAGIDVTTASFSDLKGLLKMPVKGKIVSLYGRYYDAEFDVTHFRSGIDIQAKRGAKIQAVHAGRVIFANWFKGYGNMMIVDHGDNYYTVYAHLEDVFRKTGDFVNTGEDLATVGDSGSLVGPILHFEIRHHGKPVNPLQWIVKR